MLFLNGNLAYYTDRPRTYNSLPVDTRYGDAGVI